MAEPGEQADPKAQSNPKGDGEKAESGMREDPNEAEAEDDEECGFCKFMKAGPCGEVFEVR
eukprot:scaffold363_cov331-Pavlova_lutheri.AAC.33